MNGKAFIRMMREDLETSKDKVILSNVVDAMEYIVNENPHCEIDSHKNAEDCYKALFEKAKSSTGKSEGNTLCSIGGENAYNTIKEYLGLSGKTSSVINVVGSSPDSINLEDFL